ncbi:MAG: CHAT domain-containing protein, partial [Bacteroidota bacterium]
MIVSRSPVIFLAYANDRVEPERYLRDLVNEVRQIRQHLEAAAVPPYEIVIRPNATLDDIMGVFSQYEGRVQVFHYAGHADSLQIMLEANDGQQAPVGIDGFSKYLGSREGLRFIFLNGCATYAHAEALVGEGVLAVLATSVAISDRVAADFAQLFYQALGTRKTLQQSFREAEAQALIRQDQGKGVRGLYLDPEEAPEAFPWAILGEGGRWRLRTHRVGARGPLIPLMCDRDPQVEVFQDKLEDLLADTTHPPHTFLLHGPHHARLSSLTRRFIEADTRYYTERLFGVAQGVIYAYKAPDWPYTGDLELRKRNLKRSLARAVNIPELKGVEWSAPDLMALHHDRTGTVIFRHQISAAKWDGLQARLLEWYIGKFWNVPPGDFPAQYL